MKTIKFNTGRHYTVHGQRIVATMYDDGTVTFHDIDRMIVGEMKAKATAETFTKANVLSEYDRYAYEATAKAHKDGFYRGGVNTDF